MKSVAVKILALQLLLAAGLTQAQGDSIGAAVFNAKGELVLPTGFRNWVFIGAPLTPHGLNGGKAAFPEFHHVYVNPDAFAIYRRTGEFPEGTVVVKELVLLKEGEYPDGSRNEVSGRGFFARTFAGMDVMVKDTDRFPDTRGWGFFNFGHHSPPYLESAAASPKESCGGCHESNAHEDMVFTDFYPLLGHVKPAGMGGTRRDF
jgi:hypothetical protein